MLAITLSFMTALPAGQTYAENTSISAYPAILQIKANPGADVIAPVSIRNNGEEEVTLNILIRPFISSVSHTRSVSFVPTNQIPKAELEFVNGLRITDKDKDIKSINLYPNESKNLQIMFTAPEKATDYYLSLAFISQSKIEENNSKETVTTVNTGVATNMLISIQDGRQKTSGVITEFEASKLVVNNSPTMELLVANTGNTYASVKGTVSIYNVFGKQIASLPLKETFVLAKESRHLTTLLPQKARNEIVWNEKFLLGAYKAKATVIFDNVHTTRAETMFFSIPLIILGVVSIFIFVILGILFRVINKLNFQKK